MKGKMKKIKNWLNSKTARMSVALSGVMVALAGVASAAGEETDAVDTIVSSVTSAVQGFAGKAAGLIGVMVVAALPVAGALWLARRAFSWFKGMAK